MENGASDGPMKNFPKTERRGKLRRYIVFHDFRHTFSSLWMMQGGKGESMSDQIHSFFCFAGSVALIA
jgi:integrase